MKPKISACATVQRHVLVCKWQILLQKLLMVSGKADSVAVRRFAVEASDDGAAQTEPRSVFLFILSR